MNAEQANEKLISLIDNVWFPSESDEPFEILIEKPIDSSQLDKMEYILGKPNVGRLVDWELFWLPLTTTQAWHEEEELAVCQKFVALKTFFEEQTTDYFVAKSGKIEVDIWIIGTLSDKHTLVLKTVAIES